MGQQVDELGRTSACPRYGAGGRLGFRYWLDYLRGVDDLTRLALSAAEGDRIALHGFVRASQADVWRLCAHLGDRDRADDLTQETYLRALRALPAFRADSGARTWLLSIARRAVADALRSSQRRCRLEGVLRPRADEPGPAERVALRDAVDHLDAHRRAAFVLTQMLGLSYAEAAEVCDCPVGTIRSRLARARADLVVALADDASFAI